MSKYLKPAQPKTVEAEMGTPRPVVTPVGAVAIEEDEEDITKKKRKKKPVDQDPILAETPAEEGGGTGPQLLS